MKKNFTLIILLLLSFVIKAQTEFAPLGATWTYKIEKNAGVEIWDHYKVDSVVSSSSNDIKYLSVQHYFQRLNNQNGYFYFYNRDTINTQMKLYKKNDTVFVYNNLFNRFTPLYIFNANVGDTLAVYPFSLDIDTLNYPYNVWILETDSTVKIVIDSIKNYSFNGVQFKAYYYSNEFLLPLEQYHHEVFYQESSYYFPDLKSHAIFVDTIRINDTTYAKLKNVTAYTDLFGGISNRPWAIINALTSNDIVQTQIYSSPLYSIACYSDSNQSFRINNVDSCSSFYYNSMLNIPLLKTQHNIQIFPNPVKGHIVNIEFGKENINTCIINLIDVLGKEVVGAQNYNTSQTIFYDVSKVPSGLYIMIFEIDGQRYYHKLIKE